MMKKLLLIISVALLTSCVFKTHYIQDGAQAYEKTDYNSIKIYSGQDIGLEYTVIGSVAADAPGNGDKVLKELKKEAALVGADAIINLRLTKFTSFGGRTGASGVAVKIK
ncbi:MAG: hypothetical protein D8M58_00290 [Calditrichaeota bacterium]|nr:MAG: hypothetical protein DWQ03_06790 [Calditrichota bacterium]MBL1203808.1 hypothetical protein [Calditrichota bacterium]NOG43638.1 hypothetical protein [Calditrichota bacterium]